MSELPPDQIWLQWDAEDTSTDTTWAEEQIETTDPEYIRADIVVAARAPLEAEIARLTAERDALAEDATRYRYRWLCDGVQNGDWSIGKHVVIDSYGFTEDTFADDKADADAMIDQTREGK